jgi:2-polyprenyl-6-methoxyphenol hydroxylase-like FAD-dependent oxidoreductase
MALLERLGLGQAIRDRAFRLAGSTDLLWTTGLGQPPVLAGHRPAASGTRIPGVALEQLARTAARAHPLVDIREGWTCVDLRLEPTGVVATLADADTGVCHTVRARYLAGCDGADSTVRRCLGIALDDSSTDSGFCTVYFRSLDGLLRRSGSEFATVTVPGVTLVSHDSAGTWSAVLAGPADEPLTDPIALLRRRIGVNVEVDQVVAVVQREGAFPVASTYGKGPAYLVGDAAHPFYPAYDQAGDTMLDDAAELADRLAAALGGSTAAEGYEAARRPAALVSRELCTARLQLERRFARLCAAGLSRERLAGMLRRELWQLGDSGVHFGQWCGGPDPEGDGEVATAAAWTADPADDSAGDHVQDRRLAW